jgi:hypothetical protein
MNGDGRELGVDEVLDGRRVDVAAPGHQEFGELVVAKPVNEGVEVIELGPAEPIEILIIGMHEREIDCLIIEVGDFWLDVISSITHSDHLLR